MNFFKTLILLLTPVLLFPISSQVAAERLEAKFNHCPVDSSSRSDSTRIPKVRKVGVLPLPAFGYAPERGWYFGAVSLFTLNLYRDSLTRTSNAKAEINYTQKKQLILEGEWNYFSKADRYNLRGYASYRYFPENFWGIGNQTTTETEELYESRRIELNAVVAKRVHRWLYVGPRYQLQSIYDIVTKPGTLLNRGMVTGAAGGISSGAGYVLSWDSRNNVMNPQRGALLFFSNVAFQKLLYSDFNFVAFEVDVRKYLPLFRHKGDRQHTLALQTRGVFNAGNPPFRMMALLGSDMDMRGYYRGRYRDRNYISFQAEYRVPLFWRIGMTAFVGAGDVAPDLKSFRLNEFKPALGTGLRFMLDRKDRVNLRLDMAWGKDSSGFYLGFGEAF